MEFNTLVAKRILGTVQIEDFADWAESLLYQGCESQNVAILASFGLENKADLDNAEVYFKRCVHELGLVFADDHVAILEYAKNLAADICTRKLKPSMGLGLLKSFWMATDRDEPLYKIWYELAADVYLLEDHSPYLWNTSLSENNIDEFIVKFASQFLQLCDCELPEDFFNLSACEQCGHVGKPQTVRVELVWLPEKLFNLIYGRNPTVEYICEQCASRKLKSMRDYEGRELYLAAQTLG